MGWYIPAGDSIVLTSVRVSDTQNPFTVSCFNRFTFHERQFVSNFHFFLSFGFMLWDDAQTFSATWMPTGLSLLDMKSVSRVHHIHVFFAFVWFVDHDRFSVERKKVLPFSSTLKSRCLRETPIGASLMEQFAKAFAKAQTMKRKQTKREAVCQLWIYGLMLNYCIVCRIVRTYNRM